MLHETDQAGFYCISAYRQWRPGVYVGKRAARYALRADPWHLEQFWKKYGPKPMTFAFMQQHRDELFPDQWIDKN